MSIDFKDIEVEASYDGPRLEEEMNVTSDWVKSVLSYMKDQKKLHKRYLI